MTVAVAALALAACSAEERGRRVPERTAVPLDSLGIEVPAGANRAVSFTNKRSAYFYTQTRTNDHAEHAWFRGLNIAGRRVFNDIALTIRGSVEDPATATVVVRPDALIRAWPDGVTETLRLVDGRDIVLTDVTGDSGAATVRLSGDQLTRAPAIDKLDHYTSASSPDGEVVDHVIAGRAGDRFIVAVAPSPDSARSLFEEARTHADEWIAARRARLEGLINGDRYLRTDDDRLTESLRWIVLTTDELITRQRGAGIYAGLPWFNEYWGRDSFISLAGATLVTGHFAEARAILTSFARFQDLDPASPFFGRLPNIVKPGSTDYHTTDGTPRWVIALRDYVRYSGDTSIVAQLMPNVAASIEGSLARWTDSTGYLLHADNETWMDARREPDHAAYSPRGTRANDIQALWHEQLLAGAQFARISGDTASSARWTRTAERLRERFTRDFVDRANGLIADRLDTAGNRDWTLRPNLFFALDMLEDDGVGARATRRAWEALAYPWGVATLARADSFFHPYHLAWEHYHKDEAYHNGTVWLWLDGIAIQRMVEDGQTDIAWRMFRAASDLALERGVVGGLPETMDAFPHPGEAAPRLTGTFLQAWSNAEHLRVFYQYFLGVRPDLASGRIVLAPRLPAELHAVDFTVPLGAGTLTGVHDMVGDGARRFTWVLSGQAAELVLDIAPWAVGTFAAASGDSLVAEVRSDGVHARLVSGDGAVRRTVVLQSSPERQARQAMLDAILGGLGFSKPGDAASFPVMSKTYRRDGGG